MRQQLRLVIFLFLVILGICSCMEYDPFEKKAFYHPEDGIFITNEGNFQYGNASLSFYNPNTQQIENDIFLRANGRKLGDVAQSMTLYKDKGFVVVNNSGVVYAIHLETFQIVGGIKNLSSPRYVHIVNDTKGYITDLYDPTITVFNPQTLQKTGSIDTHNHLSTEQMVQYGDEVFVNCWSNDCSILVIDTHTDRVVDEIEVGKQPTSLVIDKFGKLWVLTDGGYEGSPSGTEPPALYRIDAESRMIEKIFTFPEGGRASEITLNGNKDQIYFINNDIWRMNVTDNQLPEIPFLSLPADNSIYYGLTVDPISSDVYVADAIDYVQQGVIYRFNAQGLPVDTFKVGITPGAFCFKYKRS